MAQLSDAESIFPRMVELRREFHRHPELSFEEVHTARTVMAELDRLGIAYEYTGPGGGVIGRIAGSAESAPTVALRAEMDALPGAENTGLPFASAIEGKMHACGHDAHMAMVLGAAALLTAAPPDGNVLLVFQPAEERGGGARVMLRSGLLDGVDAIFGGHVTHHFHVGEIMVSEGVITAHSDRFLVKIQGKGGHGSRPHEAIDAVLIASVFTTFTHTLSREINPLYPSVITVGRVAAGTAANVIADSAILEGTIRTTRPDVRDHIHRGLQRMAKALGELHGASIEVTIAEGYPPVINARLETQLARTAAARVVGEAGLVAMEHPSMGAEDFSFYQQKIPGCYVRFGARIAEREYIPLHSPVFDIDEAVLKVGAAFFDEVARAALTAYRR